MEIPVKKIARGYFKLSRKNPNHEFSLLIPAQLRTDLTFLQLKQLYGSDPQTKLSYICKRTDVPIGQANVIQLLSFNS